MNANIKHNPNPNHNPNANPYPTPNQKPKHYLYFIKLFVARDIMTGATVAG